MCKVCKWDFFLCTIKLNMEQIASPLDGFVKRSDPEGIPRALPRAFLMRLSSMCVPLNFFTVLFF